MNACWLGTRGLNTLTLEIRGYEFPKHTRPDDHDSNWLNIRGEIETENWSHTFQHPCLLTWEVEELIEWLASLRDPARSAIDFLEPLLGFRQERDDPWALTLVLKGEALPRYLPDEVCWFEGISLTLLTDENNRDRFVESLRKDLSRFPRR